MKTNIVISSLKELKFNMLNFLLSQWRHKPYGQYQNMKNKGLTEYTFNQISNLNKTSNIGQWFLYKKEKLKGFSSLERLPWDSKEFGINMARISYLISNGSYEEEFTYKKSMLQHILKICLKNKINYIFSRTSVNDLSSCHALEDVGFQIIDNILTFTFFPHLQQSIHAKNICKIRLFKKSDVSVLKKIAISSFTYDRFHNDPKLSQKNSDVLHGNWIENCCKDKASLVLVAEVKNKVVGFIACSIDELSKNLLPYKFGSIVLIAISENYRRKGIGRSLVNQAMERLKKEVEIIEVGTQTKNYHAINMYKNLGFKVVDSFYSFRKWRE